MGGLFVDAKYKRVSSTCLLDYLASGANEYNSDRHEREVLLLVTFNVDLSTWDMSV